MSTNGKGSTRRRSTKEERKKFEDNYENIFIKKQKKTIVADKRMEPTKIRHEP
jgi:hypothetical protein